MSRRMAILLLALGLSAPAPAADPMNPQLVLVKSPGVRLIPRPPLTAERAAQIKKWIARLAEVDRPDVGYSPTFGGYAFLPVPGHLVPDAQTWTDHGLRPADPLRELVAAGPDALPFLLDALGDKTPTGLTFKHRSTSDFFREGATWFAAELPGNALNPREAGVADAPHKKLKSGGHVATYRVRVGDLCFVAVGQIVGRPYMAARYQMTACAVINSPVEDAALRERVRTIWASADPTRTLFDSLWLDYRTTGTTQKPGGIWSSGSQYQSAAALRLLYYFPKESAPVIAARLNGLDVGKATEGSEDYEQRGVANGGVHADEFVRAAAWCPEPAIREAVRGVFRRTGAVWVFDAAAEAFGPDEVASIVRKGDELLAALSAAERADGEQYRVLGVVAARAGAAADPAFRRALDKATPAELGALAGELALARGTWPVPLLKPLLDDTRPTARTYAFSDTPLPALPPLPGAVPPVRAADDGRREVPVRVCDAAAKALAALLPGERGQFPAEHDRAGLDRYIARLKRTIPAK